MTMYARVTVTRLLDAVAQGVPLAQAAKQCGLSRRVVYHWRASRPEFARLLREARKRALEMPG